MKKIFFILSFIIISNSVSAQLFTKDRILRDANAGKGNIDNYILSWGYYLGFNSLDFNFDYTEDVRDVQVLKTAGFNVGLIGNLKVNKFLDLRLAPGLSISRRELNFSPSNFEGIEIRPNDLIREVQSTYVYFPLLAKFSTKRLNNFKPYILGGFATAINLSSNEDNREDNSSGQFRTKTNVFFYELGFGIDFYFEWFKFSPSIRGVFGINDELIRDADPNSPWTGNIDSIKTRGIFINLTVQ